MMFGGQLLSKVTWDGRCTSPPRGAELPVCQEDVRLDRVASLELHELKSCQSKR